MLRALGWLGPAGLAFLATAALLRTQVPLPEKFELEARFERLRSGPEPYPLVFLGPSTTRCGFDPRALDAELARLGHPIRTFNLGTPGARAFELDHQVELLIEAALPPLVFAVVFGVLVAFARPLVASGHRPFIYFQF